MPPPENGPAAPSDATTRLPSSAGGEGRLPIGAWGPTQQPGALLAGRYRIVRWVGAGGMGEVYEAEDIELQEHVALKLLRPDVAAEPQMLERFRREIHLARKVTHPNVCRIFDLFHHSPPGGGELLFLTMELLRGENLRQRLERVERMSAAEAGPIVEQAARALEAAHAAGVVHRDLKSANIVLVDHPDGTTRAVVTDFGLACATPEQARLATLTHLEQVVGTPAYMAPEQVAGEPVGAAADLYALGVVMYEMLTGDLPFVGESALSTAVKRLSEPPPSPRARVPDLDPLWDAAVLRCLERQPADRFASAAELCRALGGEAVAPGRRQRRRRRLALAAATLVAALAVGGLWLARTRPAASGFQARPAVAVLGFKNLTGQAESDWLSTALAEMMATELASGEQLRTVPGETVAHAKLELGLPELDTLGSETLARLRRLLGTDYVVVGSYAVLPGAGTLRVDLRMQDAIRGDTIVQEAVSGTAEQLFDLVARAGALLRGGLGVAPAAAAASSLPEDPQTARLYAEGLARLRQLDALGARERLEEAARRAPGSPQVHAALASALGALGYDAQARAAARRASELATSLPRAERLLVEGSYHETAGEWEAAIAAYQVLWGFFSDNLEYGLRLARAQTAGGRGEAALETVAALRGLPAPAADDPRIELAAAEASGSLSDFRQQLAAARAAARKGEELGARLLVARARLAEAAALRSLGDGAEAAATTRAAREMFREVGDRVAEARATGLLGRTLAQQGDLEGAQATFEEVLATYRDVGHRRGVADALHSLAVVRYSRGDLEGARPLYEQSIAAFREAGDRHGVAMALNNLAILRRHQGEAEEARRLYEEARAVFRAIGDRGAEARASSNIAQLLLLQGDLPAARQAFDQALAVFQALGDRNGAAGTLSNLGYVLALQGDLAGAEERYGEALALYREIDERSGVARLLRGLAGLAHTRGQLPEARRLYQEALDLRRQLGEDRAVTETELALADLALDEGRPAEAAAEARRLAAAFAEHSAVDGRAAALLLEARALLAQGQAAAARAAADTAGDLVRRGENRPLRLSVTLLAARARAAAEPAAARAMLETARDEARAAGLAELDLEARLALAELALVAGDPRPLAQLAAEADRAGYGMIATRARRAAASGAA